MIEYPRLTKKCIDADTDCRYRYVYGFNDIFNPHCHEFFEIFVTVSGTVTHLVNDVVQKLPEGSMVFIRPDDRHGFLYDTPESKDTVYINLAFSHETARLLFEYLTDSFPSKELLKSDMPPTILLNKLQKERIMSQVNLLNRVNWQNRDALKLRMRTFLADIFAEFFFNAPKNDEKDVPLWLSRLLSEMESPENFTEGIEKMISLSKKSREHLSRSMKKYCGITAAEYINELRISYASNLLIYTNSPILEVCFSCGFQSQSYFYKIFKNKYRLSPKEFREKYAK